ncbi:hypothetical protein F5Y16DRAFT_410164 [Xylariaceae sp. FL0255]|nr:hypothetical protein F5Y16DRAFT_410164 [Xylariaceae sp. FL0255]
MVSLDAIRASNARIKSDLSSGLVAVFIGATGGIEETTLKSFVKNASKPRIYFSGRSQDSGVRGREELRCLNPDGEYHFMQYDGSLLRNVDSLCQDIKAKEEKIDKGLYYAMALSYYCRIRFVVNLLPLIQRAIELCRVLTVVAGNKEGRIFPDDFQPRRLPITKARAHLALMNTLAFENLSIKAPEVSFIHNYAVGERQVLLATSARFPAHSGGTNGVSLKMASKLLQQVYWLLKHMRDGGLAELAWKHTEDESLRVTQKMSI